MNGNRNFLVVLVLIQGVSLTHLRWLVLEAVLKFEPSDISCTEQKIKLWRAKK